MVASYGPIVFETSWVLIVVDLITFTWSFCFLRGFLDFANNGDDSEQWQLETIRLAFTNVFDERTLTPQLIRVRSVGSVEWNH